MTGQFSGTDAGNANLTITDGTTTGYGINKITVSGGDLVSASNGAAVIDTSGGGGGSVSITTSGSPNGLTITATPTTITGTGAIALGGTLAISNDDWSGTDLAVANGGTGASDAPTARTNLGAGTMNNWRLEINSLQGTVSDDTIFQIAEGTGISIVRSADSPGGNSRQTATVNIDNVAVANGGTGATTASGARTNLGAASSGANSDITSITGLTTDLTIAQGGTGASTAATALSNLGGLPLTADISASGSGFTIASTDAGKILVMTVGGAGNLAVNCTGAVGSFPVGFQCVVLLESTAGGQVQLTPTNSGVLNGSTSSTVNLTTAYKAYTLVIVSQSGGVNNWVAIG